MDGNFNLLSHHAWLYNCHQESKIACLFALLDVRSAILACLHFAVQTIEILISFLQVQIN